MTLTLLQFLAPPLLRACEGLGPIAELYADAPGVAQHGKPLPRRGRLRIHHAAS